ncbi:hypothetical protein [Tengunoibacter tsumagoiensis]|uniref:Uncharacterized protein n=1 Tax=Tengunoibacter tsumagoiensis TaxID=2014871 RepID=A0A401ZV68_9CHLR|nr:hypothetical protein [Tengunoibacter tsumagoiensis]GCE10791.1 hypothetical protein KTT_06500 [Tengunoibacter tsumagoiensis]
MKQKNILMHMTVLALLLLCVLSLMPVSGQLSQAHAQTSKRHSINYHPHKAVSQPSRLAALATAASLPTWSSSFSYQGLNYSYTMIGTNPANGSAKTIVAVDIIPLIFTFSDGTQLDGNTVLKQITGSALFRRAQFITGNTQYMDAIQRGQFWSSVSTKSPNYHVLLGKPTIKATQTLTVPANAGYIKKDANNNTVGYVDVNWFNPQADSLVVKNDAPNHLVIFSAVNIYQYSGDPNQCCIGGFHNAVLSNGQFFTYAYASYDQAGDVFTNINGLTHEIAEWANDPYVNNETPNWYATNYGCSNYLEVGDPAVGKDFVLNGLNYQDEVYFSWFAHENPSQGYNGQYDYLGTLYTSPPAGC